MALEVLVVLITSFPIHADEPDLNYENKLHEIYQNYYSKKMDPSQWKELIGSRDNESYQIQSHDNLWNISKVFFGDGNYWPKIWSINKDIVNPHLIEPNQSIRFVFGDEADAPSFAVTDSEEDTEEPSPSVKSMSYNDVEIPPPTKQYVPVLRKIPSSLPDLNYRSPKSTPDISFERLQRRHRADLSILNARIVQTLPVSLGRVSEIDEGDVTAADDQTIFVEAKKERFHQGETYVVVHNRGPLQNSGFKFDRAGLEVVLEYQGQIIIQQKVESKKIDSRFEIHRALVKHAISSVTVGSDIIKGPLIVYDPKATGPRSSVVAQIIGGTNSDKDTLFAERSIVYLNRGASDGLSVGQVLQVRSNQDLRNSKTQVRDTVVPIGSITILDVQASFATALVTKQTHEIRVGDLTGQGDLLPVDAKISENRTVERPSRQE